MKYKVGDKVRIKGLDWYIENKDNNGEIKFENGIFTTIKSKFLGQIMTIEVITLEKQYILMEDRYKTLWTDDMIEGLVEKETKSKYEDRVNELRKMCTISLTDSNYTDKVEVLLNDYEYIEENGKTFFVKKKKEYPKTYEGCWYMLKHDINNDKVTGYKNNILSSLQKLLICRDAYWKIAGEEMGLGKPWEPDWTNENQSEYGLYEELKTTIINPASFLFPTEEMRDKFYENFKDDFNKCRDR